MGATRKTIDYGARANPSAGCRSVPSCAVEMSVLASIVRLRHGSRARSGSTVSGMRRFGRPLTAIAFAIILSACSMRVPEPVGVPPATPHLSWRRDSTTSSPRSMSL